MEVGRRKGRDEGREGGRAGGRRGREARRRGEEKEGRMEGKKGKGTWNKSTTSVMIFNSSGVVSSSLSRTIKAPAIPPENISAHLPPFLLSTLITPPSLLPTSLPPSYIMINQSEKRQKKKFLTFSSSSILFPK
jgi:hypothetical protein